MSPIVARSAARAFTRAGTRQFSMVGTLRNFARGMEHTPFQRLPQTQQPAAADWGRLFKRAGGSAIIYVPAIGTFLAWPYVAQLALNGNM